MQQNTDHFICLHGKLNFVIAVLLALAVSILDLLQMLNSLFRRQVLYISDVFSSKFIDLSLLF